MKTRFFFSLNSGKAVMSAVILIFGLQAMFGQPALVRNFVPPDWQADDVQWSRDVQPHNKIDDTIDASTNQLFDVIVNFSHCPTDNDLNFITANTVTGRIQMRSRYISSVFVAQLSKPEIRNLAAYPGVAFIEQQEVYVPQLNISLAAICVAPGITGPPGSDCAPNIVRNMALPPTGINVNIAFIDSGVDNPGGPGVTHVTFAGSYRHGYDWTASPPLETDPDDEMGHGTHVASIALGRGDGTGAVPVGVAPDAGLIDVKVLKPGFLPKDELICKALEYLYDRRDPSAWNVGVINMSIGVESGDSDGTESICQLIDLAESMGIVVVCGAGNGKGAFASGIPKPGAATRAITVAAAETHNTDTRGDETIACFSNRGPRKDDGDKDPYDELKPEVAAPGTHEYDPPFCTLPFSGILGSGILGARFNSVNDSTRMSGTSVAAAHVAGVAALVIERAVTFTPSPPNAASVKDLIISTATAPNGLPQVPPWKPDSGYGYINAFAAVAEIGGGTDLTYPTPSPSPPWLSPDISTFTPTSTTPTTPEVGKKTTVTVLIKNNGTKTANNVHVHFGVHVFSPTTPIFQDIGTVVESTIPFLSTKAVHLIDWVPVHASHQCLKVEIGYGPDLNFLNNTAQRNYDVTGSPKQFMVQNTATEEPALIELRPTLGTNSNGGTNWTFTLEPSQLVLSADDCPVAITAELFPGPNVPPGELQTLHVAAVANTLLGEVLLGGLTIATVKPMAPSIVQQPTSQQAPCGGSVTFIVSAAGTDPLSYQWQHNNVDLPGATQPALFIGPVQPADAGTYSVRVSNSAGNVTSAAVTLTVLPGPAARLTIALVNSNVLIRWPVTCADYDLLETPTLGNSSNWMPATASVDLVGTEYIATAPLQSAGNRFFRLSERPAGAIPLQPPTLPLLEFSEFDTLPVGATGVTDVAWREIPGSLTDELATQIRFAAQQNPLVQSWLGARYAYIDTSPLEMPKGTTNAPGQPLQSRVTFFSHSFNWAVLADMNGTNVVGATNSTELQPPEGADEVAAALDLARADPRLAGSVQGLIGGGLLMSINDPGQPGFGNRVIHVTFSRPDEAGPRYSALVDLTLQEVIPVSTP